MNEKQRQLAYLILFLCFLYCDNCKLVQLDKTFEVSSISKLNINFTFI